MTTFNVRTTDLGDQIEMILDDGTVWAIPTDPANSDYQRYLRWLENPNEVEHLTEIAPQAALSTPIATPE
jgi:hypothetical protein